MKIYYKIHNSLLSPLILIYYNHYIIFPSISHTLNLYPLISHLYLYHILIYYHIFYSNIIKMPNFINTHNYSYNQTPLYHLIKLLSSINIYVIINLYSHYLKTIYLNLDYILFLIPLLIISISISIVHLNSMNNS